MARNARETRVRRDRDVVLYDLNGRVIARIYRDPKRRTQVRYEPDTARAAVEPREAEELRKRGRE